MIQKLVSMIVLVEIGEMVGLLQSRQHCIPYLREILTIVTAFGWNSQCSSPIDSNFEIGTLDD